MCEPASIMIAATTALSTALSIGGQVAQYSAQADQAAATRSNALAAYQQDTSAITDRASQEQQATAQRRLQNAREYAAAKATAVTSAGDAGVSGLSVNALLTDLAGQQQLRQGAVDTNLDMTLQQLQREQQGAAVTRQSRINSAQDPSLAGLLIGVAKTGVDGFTGYKTRTDPKWSK